jgi:hypothetical protein
MSVISAATYPNPPSFDGGADGLRPAAPGVITAQTRGQVVQPQALIVLQATSRKDEIQRRKRDANGCRSTELFAPAVDNATAFNIKKGMLGICRLIPGTTFRGALQSDQGANVEVITNMAGLHRKTKLAIPCVVQVNRDADRPGSDERTTIVPDGVQQIDNSGLHTINVGSKILLDPNAATIEVNGRTVPAIDTPGMPPGQYFPPQVRSLDTNTLHSMMRQWKERLRVQLGDDSRVRAKLAAVDGPVALGRELAVLVANVVLDDKLAEDMPIKGYLSIWLPWYLLKLTLVGTVDPTLKGAAGSQTTWMVWCMQLLYARLREVESDFSQLVTDYEATLPHNLKRRQTLDNKKDRSLHTTYLATSLEDATINKMFAAGSDRAKAARTVLELQARLDLFTQDYLETFVHDLQGWLSRWTIGTALSSAAKGKQMDILIGRNH